MILAIDPSIRHLGWATLEGGHWNHGTINVPKNKTLPETLIYIAVKLNNEVCCGNVPEILIVEYPEFFQGSEKGATAAVLGTTLGLAAVAAFLQGYYKRPSKDTFFYTPSQWKGQVPKDGMTYRFMKRFGYWAKTDHEAEAALLLQYHLDQQLKNS